MQANLLLTRASCRLLLRVHAYTGCVQTRRNVPHRLGHVRTQVRLSLLFDHFRCLSLACALFDPLRGGGVRVRRFAVTLQTSSVGHESPIRAARCV